MLLLVAVAISSSEKKKGNCLRVRGEDCCPVGAGGGKEPGVTRQNLPRRRPAGPGCQPEARGDPVYAAGGGVAAVARTRLLRNPIGSHSLNGRRRCRRAAPEGLPAPQRGTR